MVRLLAIDTSTMTGGIALMEEETLIAESRLNVKVSHSERLMKELDHILNQSSLNIDDIDVFAVSIGPGSFTGLRVGLSTVKGLVYYSNKKIVSVSSLEALAYSLPFCKYPVCPMLDARKKEVYTAIFLWSDEGLFKIMDEQVIKIDELLFKITEKTVFLGEGALLYKDKIQSFLGNKAIFAFSQDIFSSPASVAYLGMIKAKMGKFDDPATLTPSYMRKSEAEIKFKG